MNSVGELHSKAMQFAEQAFVAAFSEDHDKSNALYHHAYKLEAEAAGLLKDDLAAEPNRSVLYRSAASLASQCGEYREAERLIAYALTGNPPQEIADELRNLLDQVNFYRHLELKDISIQPNELEVSIAGKETGWGIAPSDIVLDRLQQFKKLVHRTVERMFDRPYREGGSSSLANNYPMFLKAFNPGSFAVSLTIGQPMQMYLPGMEEHSTEVDLIKEILDCIELLNESEEEALRQRIVEPAYYNNFIGLMKDIAPDGENVRGVNFSTIYKGETRNVPLLRKKEAISQIPKIATDPDLEKGVTEQVKGILRFADAVKATESGTIKLIDEHDTVFTIVVPQGMDDIVGPLWSQTVLVRGKKINRKIYLENIERIIE